jgi:uncharacterized protein (TIGR02145 family)
MSLGDKFKIFSRNKSKLQLAGILALVLGSVILFWYLFHLWVLVIVVVAAVNFFAINSFRQVKLDILDKHKSKLQLAMILLFIFLALVALWYLVHLWVLLIALLIIVNLVIFVSYQKDMAVPFVESFLAKEYLRMKTALAKKSALSVIERQYQKVLQHFLILFLNSQKSFELLLWNDEAFGIKFDATKQTLDISTKETKSRPTEAFFDFYKLRKKKLIALSLGASTGIILSIILLVFILPSFHKLNAFTYGWVQTSWTGGASTTTVAVHPGDKTSWLQYFWASANMFISTSLTPNSVATSSTDTTTDDFSAGTFNNAYATSSMVVMLKPTGATCAYSYECAGGYCADDNTCFNCGVDTVQYEGGPYNADGSSTSTTGYYRTVLIGTQCWLKDDLNVGTMIGANLANDTTIQDQTNNSVIEKYCYGYKQQDNATQMATGAANCAIYGGMYQWPEALAYNNGITLTSGTPVSGNIQGICPSGWHIPSSAEFVSLATYLGGASVAGGYMKETGTVHWNSPNNGADNSSGFTAIGGSYRNYSTTTPFLSLKESVYFTKTEAWGSTGMFGYWLRYDNTTLQNFSGSRTTGSHVRCIKGTGQ